MTSTPSPTPEVANAISGLSLLDQADTLVSIAATAPSGAATYRLARQSALAAQAASDALEVAAASYSSGNYAKGDSAAKVAIGMAELANQALIRPSPVLVVEPNPSPGVLITATGNHVPNSYAGRSPAIRGLCRWPVSVLHAGLIAVWCGAGREKPALIAP